MKETMKEVELERLLYWMEERQRIYLKRSASEPPPWTSDPILQKFRFCCTYRENDKVTKWIRENWREPYADHKNLWFAMCIARQINWPDTLEILGFPRSWSASRTYTKLVNLEESRVKVYTSAYRLGAGHSTLGMKRSHITTNLILDNLWKQSQKSGSEPPWLRYQCPLEVAFEYLKGFYGFGPFMAYEVVTDLRHTKWLNPVDANTWCNVGPGARRGLNRIIGRELRYKPPGTELLVEIRWAMSWIYANANRKLLPTLEMRDVEHSLCEFDKYCRAYDAVKGGDRIGLEEFKLNLKLV